MNAPLSFNQQLSLLDERIEKSWADILENSRLVKAIREGGVSRALYAIYMIETFHYTAHNARNQGLVGVRHADNPVYAKFCFEHAAQEVGHEKMALHDVMSLGLKHEVFDIPSALPETEVLIAYLYWISFTGNPLQRLGYSYWAENAYQFITPLINRLSETLELKPAQLTFLRCTFRHRYRALQRNQTHAAAHLQASGRLGCRCYRHGNQPAPDRQHA